MKFDKKLAVEILEMISKFPVGFLLCESPDHVPDEEFIELIPCEMYQASNFSRMLAHIYILSHSGLIFPQMELKTLQELDDLRVRNMDNDDAIHTFRNYTVPGYLMHYTLTVQGYDYLEELQRKQ